MLFKRDWKVDIELSLLKENVWIPTPEDVLEMVCFGQSEGFREYVEDTCFQQIYSSFGKHSTDKGIRTTGFYYLIQATAK